MTDDILAAALAQADACGQAGRLTEMEYLCRQIVAEVPGCAPAWNRLGVLLGSRGEPLQAVAALEQAIALAPQEATFRSNLGEIMRRGGLPRQAVVHGTRAVELNPDDVGARVNLGLALLDIGDASAALPHFEHALARNPGAAGAWLGAGLACVTLGRPELAGTALKRCLELGPGDVIARQALARLRLALDDIDGALDDARTLVKLAPDNLMAVAVLADVQMQAARPDQAEATLRAGIARHPSSAALQYRLALARLAQGDYREGFAIYEWRLYVESSNSIGRPVLPMPAWNGEDLRGKRILVLTEQGFGDHLQFCRFVPRLAATGAEVVMGVSPELSDLMRTLSGVSAVQTMKNEARASGCDVWTFVGSLPWRLGISRDDLDTGGPYVSADPARRAAWRERLAKLPPGRRVGLVWAGRPTHENDARRSLPFAALEALAGIPDVCWVSLQAGPRAADAERADAPLRIHSPGAPLADFADTAALMAELDLVITVDTSSSHLAGALGRPTWVLLPWAADWRWWLEAETTPWYPATRLFRQSSRGDWAGVLARVAAALRA
jgi:tetratricopeptide (TPR) repeat protein